MSGLIVRVGRVTRKALVPPKVKNVSAGSIIAGKVGEVPANSGKIFLFSGKPAILVRTTSTRPDSRRRWSASGVRWLPTRRSSSSISGARGARSKTSCFP